MQFDKSIGMICEILLVHWVIEVAPVPDVTCCGGHGVHSDSELSSILL